MAVFEPEEAKAAITIFSLTGAIGNALGELSHTTRHNIVVQYKSEYTLTLYQV
jgi:hypothetical protein